MPQGRQRTLRGSRAARVPCATTLEPASAGLRRTLLKSSGTLRDRAEPAREMGIAPPELPSARSPRAEELGEIGSIYHTVTIEIRGMAGVRAPGAQQLRQIRGAHLAVAGEVGWAGV